MLKKKNKNNDDENEYYILEDKSKEDFAVMLSQHELNDFKPIWDTYKIISINDKEGTSETWYSVILVKKKKDGLL